VSYSSTSIIGTTTTNELYYDGSPSATTRYFHNGRNGTGTEVAKSIITATSVFCAFVVGGSGGVAPDKGGLGGAAPKDSALAEGQSRGKKNNIQNFIVKLVLSERRVVGR